MAWWLMVIIFSMDTNWPCLHCSLSILMSDINKFEILAVRRFPRANKHNLKFIFCVWNLVWYWVFCWGWLVDGRALRQCARSQTDTHGRLIIIVRVFHPSPMMYSRWLPRWHLIAWICWKLLWLLDYITSQSWFTCVKTQQTLERLQFNAYLNVSHLVLLTYSMLSRCHEIPRSEKCLAKWLATATRSISTTFVGERNA